MLKALLDELSPSDNSSLWNNQKPETAMKKYIIGIVTLAFSLALNSQAAIIQFNLSPAGTDAAVGLSPLNEVPAATNSTGSGNEISAGISFDTETSILTLAVGYGSAAGFSNLTAQASTMHIHGPAGPGTNAPVTIVLDTYNFRATDPTLGGVIYGQVPIPTNKVAELLANLYYINIHTANYLEGEIRGQLVAEINRPPVVACPEPVTVECGSLTTLTNQVSDPEGDALVVVWSVNGTAIQTNELAAGTTTTPADVSFPAEFPLGTNNVVVTVTDSATNTATCSTTVTVVDTIPPVIVKVIASPNCLWPPNHKMVPVRFAARVTDACGPTSWKIISITSNQAVNARGSGKTAPDWEITGDHTASLRAERSGKDGSRIYTITVQAKDGSGNMSAPKTVVVTVPHDQGDGDHDRDHDRDQGAHR
jgi:hypothetical protein